MHDSSFMDSQSFLDCSSQSQHPPQSPVRSISSATDNIPHPIPSAVTTQRVETSSLAKVRPSQIVSYFSVIAVLNLLHGWIIVRIIVLLKHTIRMYPWPCVLIEYHLVSRIT